MKEKLLNELLSSGKIKYDDVANIMKDLDLLDMHNFDIWYSESSDFWITHVKDETRKNNKRRVKRRKKEALFLHEIVFGRENY